MTKPFMRGTSVAFLSFPKLMMVGDDKTGAMNLKVREQRQRKDLPSDQAKALEDFNEKDATQRPKLRSNRTSGIMSASKSKMTRWRRS